MADSFRSFTSISAESDAPPGRAFTNSKRSELAPLTFRLDLPRASNSDHGPTHTVVTVNHVDNKFTIPTLRNEVADNLASFPQ